jgi:hypothetical protein
MPQLYPVVLRDLICLVQKENRMSSVFMNTGSIEEKCQLNWRILIETNE